MKTAVSLEQGRRIAGEFLRAQSAASEFWRRYQFAGAEETSLLRETPAFWVFFLPSQQLIEESHIPGGLIACVDKNDGHIWTDEAQEAYFAAQAARQMVTPQPARAA